MPQHTQESLGNTANHGRHRNSRNITLTYLLHLVKQQSRETAGIVVVFVRLVPLARHKSARDASRATASGIMRVVMKSTATGVSTEEVMRG